VIITACPDIFHLIVLIHEPLYISYTAKYNCQPSGLMALEPLYSNYPIIPVIPALP
jgi:hypothetical protein